jgi:hypothetical protein
MFDEDSRYADVENATYETDDGREVVFKRRRFIPRGRGTVIRGRVRVERTERVDHISARTLGDPRQFWRILDASGVMNPRDVDEGKGLVLKIPVPGTENL